MKVCVVMSNDYPDSVFASRDVADRYCEEKRKEQKPNYPYIHYAIYEFEVKDRA